MSDLMLTVTSATTGALVAYLVSLWQTRNEARRVIHERIHEKRTSLYPTAWKISGRMPRRKPTSSWTYGSVSAIGDDLSDWYYEEGGMYLSGGSRRAYSSLQDTLADLATRKPEQQITADDYEAARQAASTFRTWLSRDLLSRSSPPASPKRRYTTDPI